METVEIAEVLFTDDSNRKKGKIKIFAERKNTLFILSSLEERQFNEESIQLVENGIYEYELIDIVAGLDIKDNPIVVPSRINSSLRKGRIETGSFNGLFPLFLEDKNGNTIGRATIEIRSTKVNYREDYRRMLDYIGNKCNDLLLDIKSPTQLKLVSDPSKDPDTIQQKFAFIKSILDSREFKDAVNRVTSSGHKNLIDEHVRQDIRKNIRANSNTIKQIAQSQSRMSVPPSHGIHRLLSSKGINNPSIPTYLTVTKKIEVNDTPENRFIKYTLQVYSDFLSKIEKIMSKKKNVADKRLLKDVKKLNEFLYETLSVNFFRGLPEPTYIPFGSPVLQKKAGYRELMQVWLRFHLAANLIWEGSDDVYGSGKRDLPLLYEYWLFFQLLELVSRKFSLSEPPVNKLIEMTPDGFYLKLKSGKQLVIDGIYNKKGRNLHVQFSYNKTFNWTSHRGEQGSWTQQMRPDYTLSFWPAEFSSKEAERQELMVHIHFDAKYKVDNIEGLFGKNNENLDEEKERQRAGVYKRADLLKMHSYRDSIKRSEGAYVLYPGTQDKTWAGYHEILPGVGAFAITPGKTGEAVGISGLSDFLNNVVEHLCNRSSKREQLSFNNYIIQNSYTEENIFSELPERKEYSSERERPIAETNIVVATLDNQDVLNWIIDTKIFASDFNILSGVISVNPLLFMASHVLLLSKWNQKVNGLFKINNGPLISTFDKLKSLIFPDAKNDCMYIMCGIESDNRYDNIDWKYIENRQAVSVITFDEVLRKYT